MTTIDTGKEAYEGNSGLQECLEKHCPHSTVMSTPTWLLVAENGYNSSVAVIIILRSSSMEIYQIVSSIVLSVPPHLKFSTVEGAVTIAHSSNPSDPPMISGPDGGERIHGSVNNAAWEQAIAKNKARMFSENILSRSNFYTDNPVQWPLNAIA